MGIVRGRGWGRSSLILNERLPSMFFCCCPCQVSDWGAPAPTQYFFARGHIDSSQAVGSDMTAGYVWAWLPRCSAGFSVDREEGGGTLRVCLVFHRADILALPSTKLTRWSADDNNSDSTSVYLPREKEPLASVRQGIPMSPVRGLFSLVIAFPEAGLMNLNCWNLYSWWVDVSAGHWLVTPVKVGAPGKKSKQ